MNTSNFPLSLQPSVARIKRSAFVGVLFGALALSACAQPGGGAAATPEATVTATRGTLRTTIGGSGTIQPAQSADLQFNATGTISDVLVADGDQVEANQELARLDTSLLDAQLNAAQAQRDAAQAQRDAAVAQRAAAQAQRDAAVAQRDRIDESGSTNGASGDTNIPGAGVQALDTSNAAKSQADAQITQASSQIIQADAQIRQADAQIRQADAQLEQAEGSLEQATLRAPFAGTVIAVNVSEGDNSAAAGGISATGGASAPFTIADTSRFYVEANINEADIAGVQNGQTAQITVDALNSEPITGTVSYIAPAAATVQNVTTYRVEIDLPQDIENLRIGMSASVDINQDERADVLIVPASAIRSEGDQRIIRIKEGEQFVDRQIQTGLSNDVDTEVVSGLNENDVIAAVGTPSDEE